MREAEVTGLVQGHKVYVRMRHIDTDNSLAHLDARTDLLEALGDALGKEMQLAEELVVKVKDIVHLLLGDAENVSADDGINIQECQAIVGLGDTIAWNLARNNFTENEADDLAFQDILQFSWLSSLNMSLAADFNASSIPFTGPS